MQVGPLINRKLLVARPDQSLVELARQMIERQVGSAVVMTDQGPSIITERDLLRAVAAGANLADSKVDEFMTSRAITVQPTVDLRRAAEWMLDGNFRHLVVVGDHGEVEGVLSMRDLMAALLRLSQANVAGKQDPPSPPDAMTGPA